MTNNNVMTPLFFRVYIELLILLVIVIRLGFQFQIELWFREHSILSRVCRFQIRLFHYYRQPSSEVIR